MRISSLILVAAVSALLASSAFAHGDRDGRSRDRSKSQTGSAGSSSHSRDDSGGRSAESGSSGSRKERSGSSGSGSHGDSKKSRSRSGSGSSGSASKSQSRSHSKSRSKSGSRERKCDCKRKRCPGDQVQAHWENYGAGLAGCYGVPGLTMNNQPLIDSHPEIVLGNEGPATQCALIWSFSTAEVFVELLGGTLLVGAPFLTVGSYEVPSGGYTFVCSIPCDCKLAGLEFFLQTVCVDECGPNGFSMSRGMLLRVGNY